MEIFDGIHQLKAPMPHNPLGYTLVYLIKGEGGYVLVDAGSSVPGAVEAIEDQMKEIGVRLADVRYIIVTHMHPDHYGLSGALRERSGAMLVTHERTIEVARRRHAQGGPFGPDQDEWAKRHGLDEEEERRWWARNQRRMAQAQQEWGWGPGPGRGRPGMPFHGFTPAEPDLTVQGGETLEFVHRRFEVLFTPGHSPDHICLYDRERKVLFTGDHVLPVITPHITYQPGTDTDPLGDYLNGLERLKALDVEYTLPAHEFTIPDLKQRLAELERHHEERNGFILAALADGEKTAYEITARVRWDVGHWEDMHPGLRRSALNECLAHLEYLRRRGLVEMIERDGRYVFRKA